MKELNPQFLSLDEAAPAERASARRRFFILGAAAVAAAAGLVTALALGAIGFDTRRANMHEARLKGILVQTPTVYQVTEGLKEKAPLVTSVDSDDALRAAVSRWGGEKASEIVKKAAMWSQLRIFSAGDMMYFIYFDEENIMRDYLYVSSSGRE